MHVVLGGGVGGEGLAARPRQQWRIIPPPPAACGASSPGGVVPPHRVHSLTAQRFRSLIRSPPLSFAQRFCGLDSTPLILNEAFSNPSNTSIRLRSARR